MRGRPRENRRVLERGHAVDGARPEAERITRPDLELLELAADRAELECGAARLDVPGFVLDLVVLQAQGMARADEEHLAHIVLRLGPDQLVAPRLLHVPGREDRLLLHESHSGWAVTCSSALRSSFGVFTVSQRPVCRNARREPSSASSGKIVVSWSPFSGKRSIALWL